MATITITEILAEKKTIEKRFERELEFVLSFLTRQSFMKDPHGELGGSVEAIKRKMQSMKDLLNRYIKLKAVVEAANLVNEITVLDRTMSIKEWIVWKQQVLPLERKMYASILARLERAKTDAKKAGVTTAQQDAGFTADIVINVSEPEIHKKLEDLDQIAGTLDGLLSLKNATISLEV